MKDRDIIIFFDFLGFERNQRFTDRICVADGAIDRRKFE